MAIIQCKKERFWWLYFDYTLRSDYKIIWLGPLMIVWSLEPFELSVDWGHGD